MLSGDGKRSRSVTNDCTWLTATFRQASLLGFEHVPEATSSPIEKEPALARVEIVARNENVAVASRQRLLTAGTSNSQRDCLSENI